MSVFESRDYQAARERIKGNPIIAMMAAGVLAVPLAELAHEDGTPRSGFMNQADRTFDDAEAVLAERAAMREAVASAMATPGTDPQSPGVTAIIERLRAGEPPAEIARQTGAIAGPCPGSLPPPGPAGSGGAASRGREEGTTR